MTLDTYIGMMETFSEMFACADGACCCMQPKTTIVLISTINLALCVVDLVTWRSAACCPISEFIDNLRIVIVTLFLIANILLLLGGCNGNVSLVRVYVWYAMSFVVVGLLVSLLDLITKFIEYGLLSFVAFIPEVLFLFVLYECLPLVDNYRKHIQDAPTFVRDNYRILTDGL